MLLVEVLPPRELGVSKHYTMQVSLDGGKTFVNSPSVQLDLKNENVSLASGYTKDDTNTIKPVTVNYIDSVTKKPLAKSDTYKVYGVSMLRGLNIQPKQINGYELVKSPDENLLKNKFVKNMPGYKEGKPLELVYEYSKPVAKVTLSKSAYTYNGKNIRPSVKVTDKNDNPLDPKYYTVIYPKSSKNTGSYTVKINLKDYSVISGNNWVSSISKTYTISPKKVAGLKAKAGKKSMKIRWKKAGSQASGYQIKYSTNKKFSKKGTKTISVSKGKSSSKTVKKLKSKKRYFVKIRAYKTVKVNGKNKKLTSAWSKTVKTSKIK